jgi:phosphoribosyl 1,2-cyclic phosphodiesterase
MTNNAFQIRGARGTMPACGGMYLRYGGHTTCFSLRSKTGWIVVDAGSGLSSLSQEIGTLPSPGPVTILLTHLHMDHLIGLPAFRPLYQEHATITLMANPARANWRDELSQWIRAPFWPVNLSDAQANLRMTNLPESDRTTVIDGIQVSWFPLPHPQHCLAFRFDLPECRIVIATDAEYTPETIDPAFLSFCQGANFLLLDAHFLPSEYPAHRNWGHSTWATAVAIAQRSEARRLVLTHHAPTRTDAQIDRILEQAREAFPATDAACETLALPIDAPLPTRTPRSKASRP